MKITHIQFNIKWEDSISNFTKANSPITDATKAGAQLICLSELVSTGVTINSLQFAENLDGPTCSFLSKLAKINNVCVVGSFIEKASKEGEILIGEIDIDEMVKWRRSFNSLNDLRTNYYYSLIDMKN